MKWSLIVFCYNEAGSLEQTVNKCARFLNANAAGSEILLVDDGSTDDTPKICAKLAKTIPALTVIRHTTNLGIGPALKTGYKNAGGDYICAVPGDGQFDPKELSQIPPFEINVFYSFYREKNNYTFYRQALTVLNRLFNRMFLGMQLRDVNWIKVYRKEQLAFSQLQLNSSIIESEISAKLIKAGCKVVELPSVYNARFSGVSKGGSWKTMSRAIGEAWSLYRVVRAFQPPLSSAYILEKQSNPVEGLSYTVEAKQA